MKTLTLLFLLTLLPVAQGKFHHPFLSASRGKDDVDRLIRDHLKKEKLLTQRAEIRSEFGVTPIEIHTQESHLDFALRVKDVLQQEASKIFNYFHYAPEDVIHFIVNLDTIANGAATVVPENLIWLHDYPPLGEGQLSVNRDWIRVLVLHELVHVVHMDQTRGFLSFIRTVFGSIGKWGGVVPRWFSEGLAVWAESHFTGEQGRLNSPRIQGDLYEILIRGKSCQTIDCLDEPNRFPFGNLSYWAGGSFLDYLESRKAGTLRCLVESNSRKIPFFLNGSFHECVGMGVEKAFSQFKKHLQAQYEQRAQLQHPLLQQSKLLPLGDKSDIAWYQGVGIKDKSFIFTEYQGKTQYFSEFDLAKKKIFRHRLDKYISQLNPSIEGSDLVPVTIYNPVVGDFNQQLVTYNLKKKETKSYPELEGAYFFPHEGKWLILRYEDTQWNFYEQGQKKAFFSLPKLFPLHEPMLFRVGKESFLGFQSNTGERLEKHSTQESFSFFVLPLSRPQKGVFQLLKSSTPLKYAGRCGRDFVFQNQGAKRKLYLATLPKVLKTSKKTAWELSGQSISSLTQLIVGPDFSILRGLAHEYRPMVFPKKCQTLIQQLGKGAQKKKLVHELYPKRPNTWLKWENQKTAQSVKKKISNQENEVESSWESYPSLRHFMPHYWMLWFNLGDTLSYGQVSTAITDPRNHHQLSLLGRYYFDIEEFAPSAAYQYKLFDWLEVGADYVEAYAESSFTSRLDQFESTSVFALSPQYWANWSYTPLVSYSWVDDSDFISLRKKQRASLLQTVSYLPTFWDDFFQISSLSVKLFHERTQERSFGGTSLGELDFLGLQSKLMIRNRWAKRLSSLTMASYGELYKDTFLGGVLFGGGGTSDLIGASIYHEFYGIPYGDIYGNEIFTGRFQLEFMTSENYSGNGLSPFYFKESNIIAGVDYLDAQRFYYDNQFFSNESLMSYHAGFRLDMTLFYLAPVEVDFLFSYLDDPRIDSSERLGTHIFLRGRLF
jgi:hypothetical protein